MRLIPKALLPAVVLVASALMLTGLSLVFVSAASRLLRYEKGVPSADAAEVILAISDTLNQVGEWINRLGAVVLILGIVALVLGARFRSYFEEPRVLGEFEAHLSALIGSLGALEAEHATRKNQLQAMEAEQTQQEALLSLTRERAQTIQGILQAGGRRDFKTGVILTLLGILVTVVIAALQSFVH